ncbi:hypothetical protein RVW18_004219 [Enterobacter bugandensis]|nr:hypothetical protein [Enterobacter bugandensis]
MTHQPIEKPADGYLTDYQHENVWRKVVKFPTGSLSYFENYDIVVEGITFQNPERIDSDNIIMIPESEDVAWNSKIGIYGSIGSLPSEVVYFGGTEVRPFGGQIDNSGPTTRIVFEEGSVTRYENYQVVVNGVVYRDLPKNATDNAIDLTVKIDENAGIVLSGLNDRGNPVPVFEKDSENKPLNGFVIFHGTTSTCIMFRKGDLTEFADGYKLYYEDTFTTASIDLAPIHIRFESVGKNIYTEVKLVALDKNGNDGEVLFKGRYNEQYELNVKAAEAAFYREVNFGGLPETYDVGADVTFWDGDNYNDKYKSLKVNGDVKVHCYQHSHGTGIYKVYTKGDHPDLSAMGGLSKFWIGPGDWAIAFRTADAVDNSDNHYDRFRSHIAVAGLGTVISESEPADVPIEEQTYKQLAGKDHISEINCAINIFHRKTNILVANGQVIFRYNEQSGVVDIKSSSLTGVQVKASIKSIDNTRFEVLLEFKEGSTLPIDGFMGIDRAVWNGDSAFIAEGWGTPGGTIWAVTNGQGEQIAASSGKYWNYNDARPRYGIKNELPYPDGRRRVSFTAEQRNAAPTTDSRDLLWAAPVIESPYYGESVSETLPNFTGMAFYNQTLKPTVVLTDGLGNELGRSEVASDGTWTLVPQRTLSPGTYDLTVEVAFSESVPIRNQFKTEIKTHLIYVE